MPLYEKLAGDTEAFALRIGFDRDPDAGKGATQEESESWGHFQIWVEGRNLCAHWEDGEYAESVHWYMLPLLEWVTTNWDFLLHEERLPGKPAPDEAWALLYGLRRSDDGVEEDYVFDWAARHSFMAAREGGLFPDLVVRRSRDMLEFSWGSSALPGRPAHYRFADAGGRVHLTPEAVAAPMYEVIEDCVQYLTQRLPTSDRLRRLSHAVQRLREPSRRLSRVALLAGLGRTAEEMKRRWEEIVAVIRAKSACVADAVLATREEALFIGGSCEAALMFGSVSPSISPTDATVLAEVLVRLYSAEGEPPRLEAFAEERPVYQTAEPWREGYSLAEEFLRRQGVGAQGPQPVDVESILSGLDVYLDSIALEDANTRAVAVAGPRHRPTILLNPRHQTNQYPSGRRFSMAHELCHLLYDRCHGAGIAIASGPWAPRSVEQRANAFAAMLLVPRSYVEAMERREGVDWRSAGAVAGAARRLQVSYTSLVQHLHNLGRVDEEARDELLEQCGRQTGDTQEGTHVG